MINNANEKVTNPLSEILPKRLKMCRENAGLSMRDVAKKINKTAATISKWENGDVMPYGDTLLQLCDLYNVDITTFYGVTPYEFRLSPSEIKLIKLYRNSTRNAQITARTVLEMYQIDDTERQ